MQVVGITGGIGSGKSTVCRLFELFGIPVFYADEEAKKLYKNAGIKSKVIKLFGKQLLDAGGAIDKKKLAQLIFNDKPSLKRLNALIHPAVERQFRLWIKKQKRTKYVMKEAAIMIESGAYRNIDYLISVNSPKLLRINRIIQRDKLLLADINKRIKEQISDKKREKYSDAIILNDNKHSLIEQALKIHNQLLKKGSGSV